MLEVARKSDEEKLTKMKELGGLKVKVIRDTYLNTSRGVINHKDLRGGGEECDRSYKCINCKGDHRASSKNCPKYLEEQAILRYWAHNSGTFEQARAAVVVEVAKEVRPKLYAHAVRGGSARRETVPVTAQNKTESVPMAQNSAAKKARPTNDRQRTGETRKPQTFERYGTNPEVD
ncbi:RNA-directed DNA polymerase from mobile element jockey [Elysia marginata]|uniref:RNA-directed DNA polymerase from mobile element jockey n=1 Tax=Elysia marginata TaxID=1093978 RepID=A0AAV4IWE7_9GAST|nr:RNA-directed DNA polymerase from mobile element jockey [Elysia marginata]